jgi:hypothetical protein
MKSLKNFLSENLVKEGFRRQDYGVDETAYRLSWPSGVELLFEERGKFGQPGPTIEISWPSAGLPRPSYKQVEEVVKELQEALKEAKKLGMK